MFDFVAFLGIFVNPLRQFIQISEKKRKFLKILILAFKAQTMRLPKMVFFLILKHCQVPKRRLLKLDN